VLVGWEVPGSTALVLMNMETTGAASSPSEITCTVVDVRRNAKKALADRGPSIHDELENRI
jgi:hypothetical protein